MSLSLNTTHQRGIISLTVPGDEHEHDPWQGREVFRIEYSAGPKPWRLFRTFNGDMASTLVATYRDREAAEYRALAEYIEIRARLDAG